MAAGGPAPPLKPKTKVTTPTDKLILAIVELYRIGDPRAQELAADLASCIMESYYDRDEMTRDILTSYVSSHANMLIALKSSMKKHYPEEAKILSEIFGFILFGEKL